MLKHFEGTGAPDKGAVKARTKALQATLLSQQQALMEAKLPVIVLIEGWSAAGKGSLIRELINEIDPRFYSVVSPQLLPRQEERTPFLYPYMKAIPMNGKITFLDSGWMDAAVRRHLRHEITREEYEGLIRQVNAFERQLRDGGYLLIKLFLHIEKDEQFLRMRRLAEAPETEWRVTGDDLWQHREYRRFRGAYEAFMAATGEAAPWQVLNGEKRSVAVMEALERITGRIAQGLKEGRYVGKPFQADFPLKPMQKLSEVDLTPTIGNKAYKKELEALQARLGALHNRIYRKKIPVILCYEGWDAAGKGGNIRRVAHALDPRGFDVIPIASPLPHELNRHYLWRFWTRLPRTGHIAIFDRTWYGRVMVERLEGFCAEDDWRRAYNEINEFERMLTDWGAVVLKFWIHIDRQTQLERFTQRQETPEKQWKITEEDWRNREKWPEYEAAVDEMLAKTSTENAPWHIIESNDKKYARIRTLKIIVEALEAACDDHFRRTVE